VQAVNTTSETHCEDTSHCVSVFSSGTKYDCIYFPGQTTNTISGWNGRRRTSMETYAFTQRRRVKLTFLKLNFVYIALSRWQNASIRRDRTWTWKQLYWKLARTTTTIWFNQSIVVTNQSVFCITERKLKLKQQDSHDRDLSPIRASSTAQKQPFFSSLSSSSSCSAFSSFFFSFLICVFYYFYYLGSLLTTCCVFAEHGRLSEVPKQSSLCAVPGFFRRRPILLPSNIED